MMIIMHPKPPYTSQPARGALIDGRTEMACIGRVYVHTVHSMHEETSAALRGTVAAGFTVAAKNNKKFIIPTEKKKEEPASQKRPAEHA